MSLRSRLALVSSCLLLLGFAAAAFAGDAGRWRRLELPRERWFHAAGYDAAEQRVLYFGGESALGYLSDLWSLSLTPGYHWQRLEATGTGPVNRLGFSYAFDTARRRLLVFGGQNAPTYYDEVWALSLAGTPAWTLLASGAGPSARMYAAAIYDPVRDRLVVHGGRNAGGPLGDAWALSLAGTPAWTALTPAGTAPAPRFAHGAAYDPVRDRLVSYGGRDAGTTYGDLWALTLGGTPAYVALAGSGSAPVPCSYPSTTYDPVNDQLVVFGGFDGNYLADAHAYDFATGGWADLAPFGAPLAGRIGHAATYDPVRGALVVFGGGDLSLLQWNADAWSLALDGSNTWTALPTFTPGPGPRRGHSAIVDPLRDRMLVFGGETGLEFANDLWELPLGGEPVWTRLWTQGDAPSPRMGHTALYDAANDRMIVHGGNTATGPVGDTWELPLAGAPVWSLLSTGGTPPANRHEHAAVYDPIRQRMVLTGGRNASAYFDEVWELSLGAAPQWSQWFPGTPACLTPHAYHTLVRDRARDQYISYGGDHYGLPGCTQTWALHDVGQSWWDEIVTNGGPAWRFEHSAIFDPGWDRMIAFGGAHASSGPGDPARQFGDVWELEPGVPQWNELVPAAYLPSTPRPDSMTGHTAVLDPARSRMIVFGGLRGIAGYQLHDELWALEWTPGTTTVGEPTVARDGLALAAGPSPLRGAATVQLALGSAARVSLGVFDVAGRRVATLAHDRALAAGSHRFTWDGRDAAGARARAGLYFVRATTGATSHTVRLVRAE